MPDSIPGPVDNRLGRGPPGALAEVRTWWTYLLTIPIYVGCLIAFMADVTQELIIPFGLFYMPLICTAVFYRSARAIWWLAALAIAMTTFGYFFPVINPDYSVALTNRALSVVAILITAALVHHARVIQDALAEQTRRAEAAERLKTEVFTSLSNEIRKPLHGVIGMCALMMANCRPDQREPLAQVQRSGARLVAMIENLIDLTHFEERQLRMEPVDLDDLLRRAAASVQTEASEKQIAVEIDPVARRSRVVRTDPWAVRRILDNLLANALKFSPEGGVVELATETTPGAVAVVVRDTGIGMPPDILRQLEEPFSEVATVNGESSPGTGTGLTLSRRLADAMGARLTFDSETGNGTTVTLHLRA